MISHIFSPILGSQFTFSKPKKRPVLPITSGFTPKVLQMAEVRHVPLLKNTDLIVSNQKPILRKQFPQKQREING